MTRSCEVCGDTIPKVSGKSKTCSKVCKLIHIVLNTNNYYPTTCPICGKYLKITSLETRGFACQRCISKIEAVVGGTYSTLDNSSGISIADMKRIDKEFKEKGIKQNASPIKLGIKCSPNDLKEVREEKIEIQETIKSNKKKYGAACIPKEEDYKAKKRIEMASLHVDANDLPPRALAIEKQVAEKYNKDKVEGDKTLRGLICRFCPARKWGLTMFCDNGDNKPISMVDLVMWREYYNKHGKWKYTFDAESVPEDKGKFDCYKCKENKESWIPRYDDVRGHYTETPIEFIESYSRFVKWLESLPPEE